MTVNPFRDLIGFFKQMEQEQGVPLAPEVWQAVHSPNPALALGFYDIPTENPDTKVLIIWTVNGGSREAFRLLVGPVRYERARRELLKVLSE